MKGKLKKILCLLCVLTLLITSTGILPALATEAAELEEEVSTAPSAGGVEKEESGLFVVTGLDEPGGEPTEVEDPSSVPGQEAQAEKPALAESKKIASSEAEVPASEPGQEARILSDNWEVASSPQLQDGSSVMTPNATTPSVLVSTDGGKKEWAKSAKISKKSGETESVWVEIDGYPAGAYLQASNSNSKAFSCKWGDWTGKKIPIRITGKDGGVGKVTLNLKNTSNETIASASIDVTVVKDKPTLSFSSSSLSLNIGEGKSSTLSIANHSGGGSVSASVANSSVCGVRWGNWNGWNIPITVTGKSGGSTKVTVTLYNSAKEPLASVSLNVQVTASVVLTASPPSVSVNAGESSVVTVTASGTLSNGDSFRYSLSNSSLFSVSSSGTSGKSIRLVVTGKSEGSGTLTVTLNNQTGTKVTIPVTIKQNNPRVTVAPSSVSLSVGASTKVTCTGQNVSGSFSLRYTNNSPSILTCAWKDSWSGNSVPITITRKAAGAGSITITLLVGGVAKSTATIQVTNGSQPDPDPDPDPSTGGSPSYSFKNYSKRGISLALCQFMFGNTQKAKTVYNYDVGDGGVCFGMATTSGLLSAPNTPNPSAFGRAAVKDLKQTDYSSTLAYIGLSLTDFIEAMHISQMARSQMIEKSGVQNMVREVRNGGTSKPVIVCMRGYEGGHAILAYGVTSNGSLRVYDSNYPLTERTVNINGENWSYNISSSIRWNQSNGQITYIPYDTYHNIWETVRNNKGKLSGVTLQGGALLQDGASSKYLLATTADDFSLVVFDGTRRENNYEREVAVYEGGVLTAHDENVEEVFVSNVPLNAEEPNHLHMLYVPGEQLYTVHNRNFVDGKRFMDVTLSGDGLSVHVKSEAEQFLLVVSDDEKFATAMLNGLEEDEYYYISVGSSLDEDKAQSEATEKPVSEASIEGYGNGQAICLGIGEGLERLGFNSADGLCVAGADKSDDTMSLMPKFSALSTLSLNALGDEDTEGSEGSDEPDSFTQDFSINSTREDTQYQLTAEAGEGGKILPQEGQPAEAYDAHRNVVTVPENGNCTYRIQPENGYALKAIYVNGVQAAYSETETDDGQPTYSYYDGAYEYAFRDVTEQGYLYAEFAKDINVCDVKGDADGGDTVVTVTDPDEDKVLLEGVDYTWSVIHEEENGERETYIVVQALAGSDYDGVSMTRYDYHPVEVSSLSVREYNQNELVLSAGNAENAIVVAAAYERDGNQAGKMVTSFFPTVDPSEKIGDEIVIRISLQDAGLPENYLLKAFLVRDASGMRVLCDPVEVRSGDYGGGGGGAPAGA